ncbi:MAG: alpha-L-rhamnosidase C-terminal domain-containing protein [Phycisphaerae bacterium]|nr:alpha-L-rhamnosidase C-terminal domain-containing protein [Phycisphaerae bacterium]
MCDRSLATAILVDQCPDGPTDAPLRSLVGCPKNMGFSYPANANWRLWALGRMGRTDVILKDLRERWATMDSVLLNNTLQEDWKVTPDSGSQWSHCPVSPLFVLYMSVAGIRPLEPGFGRCEIRPQPADLRELSLTVRGPLEFASKGVKGDREIRISLPPGMAGELVLPDAERVELEPTAAAVAGQRRYRLPSGKTVKLHLRHT